MRHRGRHIFLAVCAAAVLSAGVAEAQSRFAAARTRRAAVGKAQRVPAMIIQGVKYSADWSLEQAEKIKDFFLQKFGREMPVSAMGQTETHDRLKFDHHNALDVALHPDSKEGRTLIGYLRQTGIPFIAFRRKVAGAATGPHIHIGNPSERLDLTLAAAGDQPPPELVPEARE